MKGRIDSSKTKEIETIKSLLTEKGFDFTILEEKEPSVPVALNKMKEAMKADIGYAWSWHCNIAVPMQDEGVSHELSNKIATRIMKQLFGVDTSEELLLANGKGDDTVE